MGAWQMEGVAGRQRQLIPGEQPHPLQNIPIDIGNLNNRARRIEPNLGNLMLLTGRGGFSGRRSRFLAPPVDSDSDMHDLLRRPRPPSAHVYRTLPRISIDLEMIIWISGLVFLALYNPATSTDFTVCPFRLLGIHWCPGCGLGHSVSYLLHGNVLRSWQCHPLGMPALGILLMRIVTLFRNSRPPTH
jgi:hypothetical protein